MTPDIKKPWIAEWLLAPIRANRAAYGQVALAATLINLFALATSLFSMTVYDRVIPNNAMSSLLVLSIGIGIVLIFDLILKSLRAYYVDIAGRNIDRDVGGAVFRQMLDMRFSTPRGSTGGFAGMLREFEALRDFFTSATLIAIVDVPFLIIFLAVIALIGGWAVLIPLAMLPLVIGVGLLVQRPLDRLTAESMKGGLSKQGVLVESIGALETIKAANAKGLMEARWMASVDSHAAVSMRQRAVAAFAVNMAGMAQNLSYVGVVILGAALVGGENLTTGGLVACSILAGRAVGPLAQIASLLTRIAQARTAYAQLDKLMSANGEIDGERGYIRRAATGLLAFDHVNFRYPGQQRDVLSDFTLRIAAGERVAIIGPTGSGKSTLARLALGLYEPSEGAVLLDNSDIRQLHPDDVRRAMGTVLQDVTLFSGSVRDNILLGREDVDDEEMLRVARLAGVHDFMARIPGGYDLALLDRGEGLSGGQRQAITIARALIGRPPILLFDEPTSAMDTANESALLDRLAQEVEGRTLLLVTHRAAVLRLVTRIVLVDGGKIVADGPRDEILKRLNQPAPRAMPAPATGAAS